LSFLNPYLKFWDLDRPLFTRVEPASALYVPQRLVAPLERLALVCEQDSPLALMTGEPGTGKTALLRWLAERLPTSTYDVLTMTIIRRETAAGWLTPRLAEHLGVAVPTGKESSPSVVRAIAARLDDYVEAGRKLVVMIDAAHLIAGETAFDELAAFVSLQALSGSCLAFVLCGGEALPRQVTTTPEIAVRIAYELRVLRLAPEESAAYLEHRVRAAGARVSFEREALDALHASTRGIITSLNVHAEGCLVEAYQRGTRSITLQVALAAATAPPPPATPHAAPPPPPGAPRGASPVESSRAQSQSHEAGDTTGASGPAITLSSLFKP
jgi:MSHA biogenesis protein MshM